MGDRSPQAGGARPVETAGLFLSPHLELHELFNEELHALAREGVTPELLADELGCSAQTIRSYGYSYDHGESPNGNGATLRRVLRLAVLLARNKRPALLRRVCAMAGFLAVPMPTAGAGDRGAGTGGADVAAALTVRECGEAAARFLEALPGGVDAEEAAGVLAEIREAQSALAGLALVVEELARGGVQRPEGGGRVRRDAKVSVQEVGRAEKQVG